MTSIAVPIFDARGQVEHCLAVTGPSVRMEAREQELIDLMLAAGHELSKKFANATEYAPQQTERTVSKKKAHRRSAQPRSNRLRKAIKRI